MAREGLLLVISGPSGAGKGTVGQSLRRRRPNLVYSVSATTRPPRPGEVEGVNYHFLSRERFQAMQEAGDLLEWAEVYGNFYGTPRPPVMENLTAGNDILLEIDIQGALQIKERFPEGVFVFIVPPSQEELAQRILRRGTEKPEAIERRLASARQELGYVSRYDYVVVNDVVEQAVQKLEAIIRAEKCRPFRMGYGGQQERRGSKP